MGTLRFLKMRFALKTAICLFVGSYFFTSPYASAKPVEDELRLKVGDETGNEVKTMKAEFLISRTEQEALRQLNHLIQKYKGTSTEGDLLFRKAELFMRQSKTVRFFELFRDSQGGLRTPTFIKQQASSSRTIEQAIATYVEIESRFPKYQDLDLVEFNHAFALQNIGKIKDAEKIYRLVVTNFPQSQWVPDCHLAMGDMDFERNSVKEALANYDAVKKFPESRVYPYGVYKAGWSRYNLGENEGALKDLEIVVQYSDQAEQDPSANHLDLRKEALNDMVVFYKQARKSADAFNYFLAQAGEKDVGPLMVRLAKLYDHHGEYKDVTIVLDQFVDKFPRAPELPAARRLMIVALDQLKNYSVAVAQMRNLRQDCELEQTKFDQPLAKNESAREVKNFPCLDALWDSTAKLSGKWHKLSLKAVPSDLALAEFARSAYEIYLDTSKHEIADRRAPIQFAYAELLFQNNQFLPASENYEAVARSSVGDSKLKHDAPYGSLVAYEKYVGKGKWSDKDEIKFKELFSLYARQNPNGPFLDDLQFKVAWIVYDKAKYDEALPVFEKLAHRARADLAEKSQDAQLDILNLKKQFGDLRQAALIYKNQTTNSQRKESLDLIYQQAYLSEIQNLEDAGKSDLAIAAYKQFAHENPGSKWADQSWMNSLRLSEKNGYYRQAAADYIQFTEIFPKSDHVKTALVKAVKLYEQIGALTDAAGALGRLAILDSEKSSQYRLLQADFLFAAEKKDGALEILLPLAKSASDDIAWPSIERIRAHDRDGSTAWFEAHGVTRARGFILLQSARHDFEEKHFESAFHSASQIVGLSDSRLPASLKAEARMIQAQILENEFQSQNVNTRPDRVALVLSIKTEKLDKAQRAYQDVIRFKDPETGVQAWEAQGRLFRSYIDSVRNMSLGANVNATDSAAFKKELEALVAPFEEKEVEAIHQALILAQHYELRDGKIGALQMHLDRLNLREPANATHVESIAFPSMSPVIAASKVGRP